MNNKRGRNLLKISIYNQNNTQAKDPFQVVTERLTYLGIYGEPLYRRTLFSTGFYHNCTPNCQIKTSNFIRYLEGGIGSEGSISIITITQTL